MMVQTLEALSACVRHVCALNEATSLESIRSLPSCILHILKDTFQHCKVQLAQISAFLLRKNSAVILNMLKHKWSKWKSVLLTLITVMRQKKIISSFVNQIKKPLEHL